MKCQQKPTAQNCSSKQKNIRLRFSFTYYILSPKKYGLERKYNKITMKYPTSPTPSISGRSSFSYVSRTQSPLPPPINFTCGTATSKAHKFIRRLFKFDQMDFEFALWQIAYLFYNPRQVIRNFSYRKRKFDLFLIFKLIATFIE